MDRMDKMKSIRIKKDGQVWINVKCETNRWRPKKQMAADKKWNEAERKLTQVKHVCAMLGAKSRHTP